MSATDDTDRRERAEKWVRENPRLLAALVYQESDNRIPAFLAGAREEAAIKDAEIAALREDLQAERNVTRWAKHHRNCAYYLTGDPCSCGLHEAESKCHRAVRRALEEKA